jgi:hypothetical protein
MTTEIRPEQRLTILKHLASGKDLDMVATITRIPKDTVDEVARHHGYPDTEKLNWAADIVEKGIESDRTAALPKGTSAPAQRPRAVPVQPTSTPPPRQVPAPEKPDEFRILINTAKNHDRARIQKLADKILEDLAKLRGLIDQEQEAFQARQREAQEKAAAKAEVDRLERELKEAKAKLRPAKKTNGATSTPDSDEPSAADVRAWATEKGIEVPSRGRLPQEIREAYDDAHQKAS